MFLCSAIVLISGRKQNVAKVKKSKKLNYLWVFQAILPTDLRFFTYELVGAVGKMENPGNYCTLCFKT